MSTNQKKKGQKEKKTEKEKELRDWFRMFDADGDGEISGKEIEKMFQAAGMNPTKKELEGVLKTADTDTCNVDDSNPKPAKENNGINFDEFIRLVHNTNMASTPKEKEDEIQNAFKVFDKNGDGVINKKELKAILELGGEKNPDIDSIMDDFDKNKDGVLQYKEFAVLWSSS